MSEDSHAPASHKPGQGKHEEEHEEHVNHEAWVIPYADMLTLLMALFLMLWATSSTDQAKFAALAESLREAFTGEGTGELAQQVTNGSPGILPGQKSGVESGDRDETLADLNREQLIQSAFTAVDSSASPAAQALQREKERQDAVERENARLNGIQEKIQAAASKEGFEQALQFKREERGLVVTVVTDDVLFDSGSATMKPTGERIITVVGESLRDVANDVMVEGHTDNRPIATAQYPTNWELSTARSTAVLRHLVERVSFPADRVAAAGYGDTHPVADNNTASGSAANRRVEITVLSS